ncbi:MAG: ABC transporter permease [Proteobacteria bacterium]|nr:ABC transporter permease [Pseudomonadota bacterium]
MLKYLLRKLVLVLPLLIGVITLIFILIELSPGDVADKFFTPETTPEVREKIVAKYGLDKPAWFRYLLLLKNLAVLDFGTSIAHGEAVTTLIGEALPNTLILSVVTLLIIYPVGVALGTIQGVKHGTVVDSGASIVSLFFYSMPSFWLALMLQLYFTLKWELLPTSGMHDPVMYEFMSTPEKIQDSLLHIILPGVAMGVASAAGAARYMRSSVLEVIRQDFVRTARAKGLPERQVVSKHVIRNAMLPIVTLLGLSLPFLFSGSVLIETIFAWPGMGRLIVSAIFSQDTPVVIGCFFVFTLVVVTGNLLADIAYALVDPRIKYD